GSVVPDGTRVAVTTGQIGVSAPDGSCCINSAGGTIMNGVGVSPNDTRFVFLDTQGGQVQIVYSAQGTSLAAEQSATARVQVLPADAAGNRVGFRAFAVADVGLTGYASASVSGP